MQVRSDEPQVTALEVILNGSAVKTRARTLDELIAEQGFLGRKIATAVDGSFVPERERPNVVLQSGTRIEILSARQGG